MKKNYEFEDIVKIEGSVKIKNYDLQFDGGLEIQISHFGKFLNFILEEVKEEKETLTKLEYNKDDRIKQRQDWDLDSLKVIKTKYEKNAIGCHKCCSYCGRKCDSDHPQKVEHECSLGHHLRGMNGIKRGEYNLSIETCEEIHEDDEFIIGNDIKTIKTIKWKDLVSQEKNWKFNSVDVQLNGKKTFRNENLQNINQKYKDKWRSKLGKRIYNFWKVKLQNIELKHDSVISESLKNSHIIFCLDSSGSMEGSRWESAKKGVLQLHEELRNKNESKSICFSLLVFDSKVDREKDVIRYRPISQSINDGLIFKGGGTNFNNPLSIVTEIISQKGPDDYDHHIILFYTDGEASKPEEAIKQFRDLKQSYRFKIQFIAISENKTDALKDTVDELKRHLKVAKLLENVKPENLVNKLPEIANAFLDVNKNENEIMQTNDTKIDLNHQELSDYNKYLLESDIDSNS
jgi:uncharacterized protein YegL